MMQYDNIKAHYSCQKDHKDMFDYIIEKIKDEQEKGYELIGPVMPIAAVNGYAPGLAIFTGKPKQTTTQNQIKEL